MRTIGSVHLALGWISSKLHWIAHTETDSIYVDEITYRRCLKEHLASQGIEWKTWMQYMAPAEKAWKRQCEEELRLQANLDFWRSVPGVRVEIKSTLSEHTQDIKEIKSTLGEHTSVLNKHGQMLERILSLLEPKS